MDYIFASGIGCVGQTGGWASSIKRAALALTASTMLTAATGPGDLEISISGLRNARGTLRLCLTQNPKAFLDCRADPGARTLSVAAREAGTLRLSGIAPGRYAISVIHDENDNGKLDTLLAVPREGFGFSRNPRIGMGPPRFEDVQFAVGSGLNRQLIEMKYLL